MATDTTAGATTPAALSTPQNAANGSNASPSRPSRAFEMLTTARLSGVPPNRTLDDGASASVRNDELSEMPEFAELYQLLFGRSGPCYEPRKYALGRLESRYFLSLPSNWEPPVVDAGLVCTNLDHNLVSDDSDDIRVLYALAIAQADTLDISDVDKVKFAAVRVDAIKLGWYAKQEEVVRKPLPLPLKARAYTESEEYKAVIGTAKRVAMVIPFLMEFTFRVYGVGWNADKAGDYTQKYSKLLASCMMQDIATFLPPEILYKTALHRVGPRRVMEVLRAATDRTLVPRAIMNRASSPPSGVALVTTAMAVVTCLETENRWAEIEKHGEYNTILLRDVVSKVKENPFQYHRFSEVYGLNPLSGDDKALLEKAKAIVTSMAPILQAYIDILPTHHALKRSAVLKRLASDNFIVYERANNLFKKQRRADFSKKKGSSEKVVDKLVHSNTYVLKSPIDCEPDQLIRYEVVSGGEGGGNCYFSFVSCILR